VSEDDPGQDSVPPEAPGRVLSTLNLDGSRRWIRPHLVPGRYRRWRRRLAVVLTLLFLGLPWLQRSGKPMFLLHLGRREFTLFGQLFKPQDTLLLALLVAGIFLAFFLVTALLGRAWCGWACPQTVYLDFVFRPMDRALERLARRWGVSARVPLPFPLQALRLLLYLLICLLLANSFLAWFVGWDALLGWLTSSPALRLGPFLLVVALTGLAAFDFLYFREQMCHLACPYGRIQAALLDPDTLIVAYDEARGEPRGEPRDTARGDCVDCGACARACPMGIDIRAGLQMECITCACCVDACAPIMRRLGRAPGLVRYSSMAALEGRPWRLLRPRLALYAAALVLVWGALLFLLVGGASAEVVLLRVQNVPYTRLESGEISSRLRVQVRNRSADPRSYHIDIPALGQGSLMIPGNPLEVQPGAEQSVTVFVTVPAASFQQGELPVRLRVCDGQDFDESYELRLLGPWGSER